MEEFFKTRWMIFMTTFLIYKDTLMTEEQIKAQRDFIRRYNIDADSVVWNHGACLHVQRLWISQVMLWNSGVMMRDEATRINLQTNNQHPDGATRESLKKILQENNIHTLFRTHEWDNVNIIHLWKIQVAVCRKKLSPGEWRTWDKWLLRSAIISGFFMRINHFQTSLMDGLYPYALIRRRLRRAEIFSWFLSH